jgi:SagB-type dehydrogenase family enzyme
MKKVITFTLTIIGIWFLGVSCMWQQESQQGDPSSAALSLVKLPEVVLDGDMSVEKAINQRRSIRDYVNKSLTLFEIAQLLWAAQGITDEATGKRAAPSAGATYPLEIYLVSGDVEGLSPGLYQYRPHEHNLILLKQDILQDAFSEAALDQESVRDAAAVIVFTAVYERTTQRYGERGVRYVHIETGHAAQNVYLQAVALGLGTVVVGAFDDHSFRKLMSLNEGEHPLYLMPIGRIE